MAVTGSCDSNTTASGQLLIADDIAFIRESIARSDIYDFSFDLKQRLDGLGVSVNAFAKRTGVTHTMVNKWLSGAAKPNGKERMKELGMALGMGEGELDEFLLANCYTKLYAKNPLDDICRLMINRFRGSEDIVIQYRAYIERHRVQERGLPKKRVSIPTANISLSMDMVDNDSAFDEWMDKYQKHFAAFDKWVIPSKDLIRFVLLYVGDSTINEMYTTGELPAAVKNLLYPLVKDKEVVLRGLRSKLIAFGLYNDMTEDEMDLMLGYARLRTLSQTRTALDVAVLTALRCAHERYPYYEFLSMDKRIASLNEVLAHRSRVPGAVDFYERLLETFGAFYENASDRVAYYDSPGKKGADEAEFENRYGDCSDQGLVGYIRDVLLALEASGDVNGKDAQDLIDLMEA